VRIPEGRLSHAVAGSVNATGLFAISRAHGFILASGIDSAGDYHAFRIFGIQICNCDKSILALLSSGEGGQNDSGYRQPCLWRSPNWENQHGVLLERVAVTIPWYQAKVLHDMLTGILKNYEAVNGELKAPKLAAPSES
jgi:hypothetical protein